MEGYITCEIPLPPQLEKLHNNSITHYNFTSAKLSKSGKCSYCGSWIEKALETCPKCGCKLVQRRVTSKFNPNRYIQNRAFEICERFEDTMIYRFVLSQTTIDDKYREKTAFWEVQRNNYSGKHAIPLVVARGFYYKDWFKDMKYADYWYGGGHKYYRLTYQILPSLEDIVAEIDQTDAKHTCVGRYLQGRKQSMALNMYSVIATAMRYPFCEYLWKMGLYKLYHELLSAWADRRILTAKTIMKLRSELKALGNPCYGQFYALWYFKKHNLPFALDDIRKLDGCDSSDPYRIHEIMKKTNSTISKVIDYWTSLNDELINREALQTIWEDELNMLMELNGYIPPKKAFPKDLHLQHDQTIEVYNMTLRKKEYEDAKEAILKVQELEYQNPDFGLAIVAPNHPQDLVTEGAVLKHCVGSYVKQFTSGRTMIVFMRKIATPNTPLGTIEYMNNRIVQCHGYGNKTEQFPVNYQEFLDEWLAHLKKKENERRFQSDVHQEKSGRELRPEHIPHDVAEAAHQIVQEQARHQRECLARAV